ncbi:3-dehydroquinate synthase [Musa troglodytarum]|uniref:3-dehydroquinate synthase n=1 Tax=Musa troglodytarum TaxID=320322 RepID=A0A9E7L4F6_9LILI|nr:3-dehydroquinate synthase [Musa troglodytarum]
MDDATSGVSTVVDVDLGSRSYPIYIGSGLLDEPDLLQRHVHGKSILVVTDTTVAPLYLDKVVSALTRRNPKVTVESVILPDGAKYKNITLSSFTPSEWETLMQVFDKATERRTDRRCTFVALGGGDACGLAAASFLRGGKEFFEWQEKNMQALLARQPQDHPNRWAPPAENDPLP